MWAIYSRELYHSGIKKMRWGLRRFQNADGSLTPAGRERYGVGPPREQKISRKEIKRIRENQKAIRSGDYKEVLKRQDKMTNEELDQAIVRLKRIDILKEGDSKKRKSAIDGIASALGVLDKGSSVAKGFLDLGKSFKDGFFKKAKEDPTWLDDLFAKGDNDAIFKQTSNLSNEELSNVASRAQDLWKIQGKRQNK